MDRIWRDAPVPALRLWPAGSGSRLEPNAAARAWGRQHGIGDGDWPALAERAAAAAPQVPFEAEAPGGAGRVRLTRVPLDEGGLLWIEPLPDDGGAGLADRLDLLEEVGRMGLAVRDLQSGRGHWDSQVFRLFGIDEHRPTPSLDEVCARVHPEDVDATRAHVSSLAERPRRGEMRFRILRPGGEVRHVHSIHEVRAGREGRPLLLDVLIDDTEIVERIAAERRVAEALDRALVLAGLSVWRIDLASGLIRFNSVGCRQNRLPPGVDSVPLAQVRAIVHPDDLEGLLRAADEAIASDRAVDLVARYDDFEGGWRTLLTRRVADRDEQGRAVALTGISIDLTAQMVERERARLLAEDKRRAEQARRDQSAFLARISQELRAPMRSLVGYIGLMTEDAQEPPSARQRQRLERIREAAQRLESITEGLLEVAARDGGDRAGTAAVGGEGDAAAPRRLLRLVCVEDNPVNMLLVRELLALRPEVELHCAENGLAGVELALQVQPQAMLLDLQLPDIGGHEVMHRVRRQLGEGACTYIALSANAMPDHIRDMLAQGFDQYWTKPIDFSAFLAGIDTLIEARRRA